MSNVYREGVPYVTARVAKAERRPDDTRGRRTTLMIDTADADVIRSAAKQRGLSTRAMLHLMTIALQEVSQ